MSHEIIRKGRVKVEAGKVLFQIAAHSNNIAPYPGPDFGKSERDFFTIRDQPEIEDHEAIARCIEGIAQSYDGGCLTERGREHDGPAAYKLWATRVKKGTGITLRPFRLSEVLYGGVPKTISGVPAKPGIPTIPKGTVLSREKAMELVEAGAQFTAALSDPHNYSCNASKVRFGFITQDGGLCFYKPRSNRRGLRVAWDTTITLLEDIGANTTYGDVVPLESIAGVETVEHLCQHPRQDLFVVVDQDIDGETEDEPRVLGAETYNLSAYSESERIQRVRRHELNRISNLRWNLPSLFTRENADLMLDRMNKAMPERNWQAITVARLAAGLIGLALAA